MTRTALVSGGSRGIGLATARALYDDGYHHALLARDSERLTQAAADLSADTAWRSADVGDASQVKTAVDDLAEQLDGFDVIVTASGFGAHFTTTTPI